MGTRDEVSTREKLIRQTADCEALMRSAARGDGLNPEQLDEATKTAIRLARNASASDIERLGAAFEAYAGLGGVGAQSRYHAFLASSALQGARYDDVIREALAGRKIALAGGLELEVAMCCQLAGAGCLWSGKLMEAERWFDEAIVSARRAANQLLEAGALSNRYIVLLMQGASEHALATLETAIGIFERLGEPRKLARCSLSRGIYHSKTGRFGLAETDLRTSIVQFEEFDQPIFRDSARLALARVLSRSGCYEEAASLIAAVRDADPRFFDRRNSIIASEYLGDLVLEQGRVEESLEQYRLAWSEAREVGEHTDLYLECSYRLALASALHGEPASASASLLTDAVRQARACGDRFELAASLYAQGYVSMLAGDTSAACDQLRECGQVAARIGDVFTRATAALALSRVTYQLGDPVEAAGLAHEARREFAQLPSPRWLAETETWLTELMAKLATAVAASNAATAASGAPEGTAPPESEGAPAAHRVRPQRTAIEQGPVPGIPGFFTGDSATRQMLATTLKIAPRSLSILVLGESGTGKEVVAEAIHTASGRKGPFVPVNCGALPGDLLEAELFGHARGAYTGADRERYGLIEHSHRGTLFLDEIGDMPLKAQARLLRALERGEVRRLGENSPRLVDLRIIAATHRNLLDMVSAGDFRLDLYHRLTGFVLKLPPLRERAGDVLILVDHFLGVFAREQDKDVRLSPEVRQLLVHHAWPGNVRQLRNVLHRLVSLGEPGQVIARLPFELEGGSKPRSLPEHLDAEEKRRILDALQSHNWNKAKAAIALGSSRTTLIGKMKRLGIDMESPGARVR